MNTISAQNALRTQLCAAQNCPNEAEPGELLCARCQRVRITPRPPLVERLWCSACIRFKPDDEFSRDATQDGRPRRGRSYQCRACQSRRRRAQRA